MGGAAFVLLVQISVFVMAVFVIWLIARRRKNWARWLLLVFFLLGIPLSVPALAKLSRISSYDGILSGAQGLAQIVALFLIFTGDARDWFRPSQSVPPHPA